MEHQGTLDLETDRLLLRKFKKKDAQAMYTNWASDPEVTKYLMWQAHDSVKVSEDVLEEWISCYEKLDYYQWAIVLKDNGSNPIGTIGVVKQDDGIQMAHIGYCIGKDYWKKGITTEAMKKIMDYLFDQIGYNRIESRFDPNNKGSGEVMKKCGMQYEGTHKMADWNNQGICDASYYALLASQR